MGEARRRKLTRKEGPWDSNDGRASLLAMTHNLMAQSDDPTLSGVTVIFPSGETIFLSAEDAKKPPKHNA